MKTIHALVRAATVVGKANLLTPRCNFCWKRRLPISTHILHRCIKLYAFTLKCGLVIGFINHLQVVTTTKYNKLQADSYYIAAARTNAQKTQPPLLKGLCWDYHAIGIQPVHWRADCCLATSCNIRLLRTQLLLLRVGTVYRAVAWQRVHQICYII
jgi:hypothetical protein